MLYYYLEGLDKKGPYSAAEIRSRKLGNETLIFTEGMEHWKPLKEFPELNTIDKVVEVGEDANLANTTLPEQIQEASIVPDTLLRKTKIKIPSFLLLIPLLLASVGISYVIASYLKQKDLANINSRIDNLFNSKTSISDYRKYGNNGILYYVSKGPLFEEIGGEDAIVKIKNATLAIKPTPPTFGDDTWYQTQLKQWNIFKDLSQYYECEPNGGFSILHITRDGSDFNLEESWSGDMAYKVPESIYHPGKDFGYGYKTESYSTSTFRPAIGTCYEEAAKYLTVENEDKSYEAGSYEKIESIANFSSKFYRVTNVGNKLFRIGNDAYVDNGGGNFNKLIRNLRITDATSAADASVFTSEWIVWYRSIPNNYRLQEDTAVFKKYWIIFSTIGAFLSLIMVLILKYRKKIILQVS